MEFVETCRKQVQRDEEKQKIYYIEKPVIKEKRAYDITKRALDICFSIVGLTVMFLPMCIITVLVMIDSSGNPIFSQERLGKNGKPFVIYKFRTMHKDAESDGPQWAKEKDIRCTKLGGFLRKTRMDELPQFFNILKGDMSLVGPRPERKYFYDQFEKYIIGFSNRMMVFPGLTGYAQVNGGYELDPEEKIMFDMKYIENRSILLDIKCVFETFSLVFTHKGAR